MKNLVPLGLALLLSVASIPAFAQGGGGGGGSSGGGSAGGASAAGAASGPTRGAASPAGSPNAGSPGAGTQGVSGVPNGPANVGGLNNSGNDPSGIGDSAKAPDVPTNNTVGTANAPKRPSTSGSSSRDAGPTNPGNSQTSGARSNDVPAGDDSLRQNGTRMPGNGEHTKTDENNSDAQIDAENRKLDGKVKSICKGC